VPATGPAALVQGKSVSIPSAAKSTPIGDRNDLVAYLAAGEKPREAWRIGTEHEKFGFYTDDLTPPPFDGDRPGIRQLLETLATRFGWDVAREGDTPVALTKGMANITLEPAGQLELSGAPLLSVHETCDEVTEHLREVRSVAEELGIGFLGMGFQPKWRRDQMPWMPKGRYKIMREYMPKVGSLGLDMMTRTCTVQVNLDFATEADMVKKFRVGLALQPIATALFANSPFTEGKPNGYKSFRSHVWTDTDADRTGMLDFVFEDGFGYERYVDYILDVPMYFSYRDGKYVDLSGQDFKKFMRGELAALPGEKANMKDWADHLTTAFPEVRLKQYLEMRGADTSTWNSLCALPAFWVGLLYDDVALDAAWDLVKDFTKAERHALRDGVPKDALALRFREHSVRELALEAVKIAKHGLKRRNVQGHRGTDESIYLEPLEEIALSGKTQADTKLELFHSRWNGSVDPVFREYAY
jgi:glutamate--cysteine ligase